MSVGEKSILVLKPEYAYGARGAGGAIPGNAVLYFEVELMRVEGGATLLASNNETSSIL